LRRLQGGSEKGGEQTEKKPGTPTAKQGHSCKAARGRRSEHDDDDDDDEGHSRSRPPVSAEHQALESTRQTTHNAPMLKHRRTVRLSDDDLGYLLTTITRLNLDGVSHAIRLAISTLTRTKPTRQQIDRTRVNDGKFGRRS
jgi:hypothetical protein